MMAGLDLLIGFVIILAVAGLVYIIIEKLIPLPDNIKQIVYYVLALFVLLAILELFGLFSLTGLRR